MCILPCCLHAQFVGKLEGIVTGEATDFSTAFPKGRVHIIIFSSSYAQVISACIARDINLRIDSWKREMDLDAALIYLTENDIGKDNIKQNTARQKLSFPSYFADHKKGMKYLNAKEGLPVVLVLDRTGTEAFRSPNRSPGDADDDYIYRLYNDLKKLF